MTDELALHYAQRPWTCLAEQVKTDNTYFWLELLPESIERGCRVPRNSRLIQLYRKTLFDQSNRVNCWILRILAANHPVVVMEALPLLKSRILGFGAKGGTAVFVSEETTSTIAASSVHGMHCIAKVEGESQASTFRTSKRMKSEVGEENEFLMTTHARFVTKQFKQESYDLSKDDTNREHFAFNEMTPDEIPIQDIEYVLNIVESVKMHLSLVPDEYLNFIVHLLFPIFLKPEGKAQRNAMRSITLRIVHLFIFLLCHDFERTKKCFLDFFKAREDPIETVNGVFGRVGYYQRNTLLPTWLRNNWQEEPHPMKEEEAKGYDQTNVNEFKELIENKQFDAAYKKAAMMEYAMNKELKKILLEQLQINPQTNKPIVEDTHFIQLVLHYVYMNPDEIQDFIHPMSIWQNKFGGSSNNNKDEKITDLLQAWSIVQKIDTDTSI